MRTEDMYFPCAICNGVESCDHAVPERKEAHLRRVFYARLGEILVKSGVLDCINDLNGPEDAIYQCQRITDAVDPILDEEFCRRRRMRTLASYQAWLKSHSVKDSP